MTTQTVYPTPTPTYDLVPSKAATRAASWIRVSVLLTIVNALLLFFGSSINFIFGMTWSYPIEDLAYSAGNALGALFIGIALALPMLWVANRARTQPRLMLAIAAAVYLIGSLVAIGIYGDFIGMAGQLVIFGLAVLGAIRPFAAVPSTPPEPTDPGAHEVLPAAPAASIASPVASAAAPAGSPAAPQTVPGSGGVAVLDAP